METKSSHILVGATALVLFVALFAFILWIARVDTGNEKRYDIFFASVSGLAQGSAVNYSGVPVGSVREIAILPNSPEFVRVRISIRGDTPVLEGTTATLSSVGFTGVAIVSLEGAVKGAPPITGDGPFGVPVIPTAPGTLDSLLNAAPQLLERVSTLTERLALILDEQNLETISGILKNTETITGAIASRDGDIAQTVTEARAAVASMSRAADEIAKLSATTNELLDSEGRPMMADLRETLASANTALAEIESAAATANGSLDQVNQQTLPQVNLLVRDLRQASTSLGAIAAKLDEDPAGALLGGRTLPTYEPQEAE
jgi:phospholipid/cholesterol/gamma-HCH transport system substrate-binding protein|tara:strand:+ start:135271 stop:136221 length:951 start_codon:yes stop_codon:yes gene_type:complete